MYHHFTGVGMYRNILIYALMFGQFYWPLSGFVSYRCLLNVNESRQHIHYHDTYVSSTDTEHDVFLSFTGVMLVLKTLYCTTLVILSDTYGYYCI